ncbi:MAG: NADH-quinone oxidoreductase subunit L [Chitinophagaceae bacterium]
MSYLSFIFIIPFIGFLVNGLLGTKYFSRHVIATVACMSVALSFALGVGALSQILSTNTIEFTLFHFIHVDKLSIPFGFLIDRLSIFFILIITGIGTLIHIFSVGYMKEETNYHYARYFAYLNLFIFFMLILVMGNNYVVMFSGWEGVGLCSYLLIGYWFKNNKYSKAARKAFIMNRVGDVGFLLGLFLLLNHVGAVDFITVFAQANIFEKGGILITLITLLFFIGATGKSAQIPLYTWLPDAMAGPTPVSALIHAATMVTAGIYLVARSAILFNLAPVTQWTIMIIGIATALMAATIALRQNDIKKVLAYSTVSQLGYMFLGLGAGAYVGSLFHVMTHAFFKALLFLGAGSIMYALHHEQNMRKMGGLKKLMPITHITMLIGCLAIAGVPPFSGFFSKDEILIQAYAISPILYYLGLLGALLTAFYMFRLYAMTFLGKYRGTHIKHVKESPKVMSIPLIALAIFAAVGGFLGIPHILGGHHLLNDFFAPSVKNQVIAEIAIKTEIYLLIISTILILGTIIWALSLYNNHLDKSYDKGINKLFAKKWYIDEFYDRYIINALFAFSQFLTISIEKNFIDKIVNSTSRVVDKIGIKMRYLQTGNLSYYLLWIVGGLMILMLSFVLILYTNFK